MHMLRIHAYRQNTCTHKIDKYLKMSFEDLTRGLMLCKVSPSPIELSPQPLHAVLMGREPRSALAKGGVSVCYRVSAGTQAKPRFCPVSKPSVTAAVSRALSCWIQSTGQSCHAWLPVLIPLSLSSQSCSPSLSPLSTLNF